jgi:hypothetical protein
MSASQICSRVPPVYMRIESSFNASKALAKKESNVIECVTGPAADLWICCRFLEGWHDHVLVELFHLVADRYDRSDIASQLRGGPL